MGKNQSQVELVCNLGSWSGACAHKDVSPFNFPV